MKRQAVVAILRQEERVLVIRRGPEASGTGFWAPPSGRVEPGETRAEAVVREMEEELGLDVRPIAEVWTCPTDDGRYTLSWWTTEISPGDPRPDPGEVSEIRWVTAEEYFALHPTFAGDHVFFRHILPTL